MADNCFPISEVHQRTAWVTALSSAFGEIEEIGAIVALTHKTGLEWPENKQLSQKNNELAMIHGRQVITANKSTGEESNDQ